MTELRAANPKRKCKWDENMPPCHFARSYREPLYKLTTSSRIHVSCSFIVSATGKCANVTLLYRGKINVAKGKLKELIKNGLSGPWSILVTENGFMNRDKFLSVLQDLAKYLGKHQTSDCVVTFRHGTRSISHDHLMPSTTQHLVTFYTCPLPGTWDMCPVSEVLIINKMHNGPK